MTVTPIPDELRQKLLSLKAALNAAAARADVVRAAHLDARQAWQVARSEVDKCINEIAISVGDSPHAVIDDTCSYVVYGA